MKQHSPTRKNAATKLLALAAGLAFLVPALIPSGTQANAATNPAAQKYQSAISASALLEKSLDLNLRIAEEGAVLLKNSEGALPLKKGEREVSVFHSIGNSIVGYFGANENYMISALHAFTGFKAGSEQNPHTVYDSFDKNNIHYNPNVRALYDKYGYYVSDSSIHTFRGPDVDKLKTTEKSFVNYNDAAIVTLTRVGVEGYDALSLQWDKELGTFKPEEGEHILQLNEGEKKLFDYLKSQNFGKIIVLMNSPIPVEIAELQDDPDIDAIMWVGYPGWNGFEAVGELLTGAVNPSGRLVDTWAVHLDKDPTYQNFGNNRQVSEDDKAHYSVLKAAEASTDPEVKAAAATATNYVSIDYAESIYVGYRFYETAAAEDYFSEATDLPDGVTDKYYNRDNGVIYPFGYGLSYTSFTQTIEGDPKVDGENITVTVKVENTGSVAGKEVVQLYYTPPYTDGGIEKSAKNLVAFAKTSELAPGKSETVTLTFAKRDMASYDYDDKNDNGHKGYELEEGDYVLTLGKNSHEKWAEKTITQAETTYYDTDSNSGAQIKNLFSAENGWMNVDRSNYAEDGKGVQFMSRSNFSETFPVSAGDVTFSAKAVEYIDRMTQSSVGEVDEKTDPWYKESVPDTWTQAADTAGRTDGFTAIRLYDMIGVDYTDTKTKVTVAGTEYESGKAAWEAFMNMMTWDELREIVSDANFSTPKLDSIGKPRTVDNDGPAQIGTQTTPCMNFACGTNIASTWNTALAEEYGKLMGDHGINQGITGWYGPGLNIHRSAFGGRNYEYFSEDGVLAGKIAAKMVSGAASKGIVTYMKHFALNNQEEHRHGVLTWTNEQAMREIYLKPFEMAAKEGGATGVMTSFNNIGGVPACENYNLCVSLLTEEWGFKGAIITDAYNDTKWTPNRVVRAQNIPLGYYLTLKDGLIGGTWDAEQNLPVLGEEGSATHYYAVRMTAQRMLYAVANSNGMNEMIDLANTPIDESKFNADGYTLTLKQGQGGYMPLRPDTSEETMKKDYGGVIFTGGGTAEINKDYDKITPIGDCVTQGRDGDWFFIVPGVEMHKGGDTLYDTPEAGEWTLQWKIFRGGNSLTRTLKVTVLSAFEMTNASGKAGTAFDGKVSLVEGSAIGAITACTAEGLPEGLTVGADGTISGRAKQDGTYPVTFTVNGKYIYKTTITIAAKSTISVNFNENYEGANVDTVEVNSGDKATMPATDPVREGYRFGGWYTDADCTQEADFDKAITAETTFYAKWTEIPPFEIGDNGNWFINGKDTGVSATGPQGEKGDKGDKGDAGEKGDKGETGASGANGADGANGGCGSVIGGGAALIALLTLGAGACLTLRRKHDDK